MGDSTQVTVDEVSVEVLGEADAVAVAVAVALAVALQEEPSWLMQTTEALMGARQSSKRRGKRVPRIVQELPARKKASMGMPAAQQQAEGNATQRRSVNVRASRATAAASLGR